MKHSNFKLDHRITLIEQSNDSTEATQAIRDRPKPESIMLQNLPIMLLAFSNF